MSAALHIVCPHCAQVNRMPQARLGEGAKCGACRQLLFTGQPVAATAAQFDAHIQRNEIPVVADFWAAWCGPCRGMAPVFAHAAKVTEPRARFLKVDTEAEQSLASRYNIRSIPTLVIFKHGQELNRVAGALDAGNFERWLAQYI
ncbi:MAG: thioredoxin TrxC [Pseudomonadota bacterium]